MNQFDKQILRGFSMENIIIQNKYINSDKLNNWLQNKEHIDYLKFVSYSIGNKSTKFEDIKDDIKDDIKNDIKDKNKYIFRYMIMAVLRNDNKMLLNYDPCLYIPYVHYLESHEDYDDLIKIIKKYENMDIDNFDLSEFRLFEEYLFDEIIGNQMKEDYFMLYILLGFVIIVCTLVCGLLY